MDKHSQKTNELKKGTIVRLDNGLIGELMDNRRGSIRRVRVKGPAEDECDIYADKIVAYGKPEGEWAFLR